MRIGIFGGTFDPPHREHSNIIAHVSRQFGLDKVVVMPSGEPPHKDPDAVTDKAGRYAMAELAFGALPGVTLSDYELERDGSSYTYLTLEHFRTAYPEDELYFIVGGDSLRDLAKWRYPERIRAAAKLIAVPRPGAKADYSGVLRASYTGRAVSSTDVKVTLEFGLDTDEVAPAVLRYIEENKLYARFSRYTDKARAMLKPARYRHSAYVTMEALALDRRYRLGIPYRDVFLASALHDIAKYVSAEQASSLYGYDAEELSGVPEPVQHSYIGAFLARKLFPELSEDVIAAIRYHTTLRAGMSPLEKVVALADAIERSRSYPGVEEIRAAAAIGLDEGCRAYLTAMVELLQQQGKTIAADTLAALDEEKENRV